MHKTEKIAHVRAQIIDKNKVPIAISDMKNIKIVKSNEVSK